MEVNYFFCVAEIVWSTAAFATILYVLFSFAVALTVFYFFSFLVDVLSFCTFVGESAMLPSTSDAFCGFCCILCSCAQFVHTLNSIWFHSASDFL